MLKLKNTDNPLLIGQEYMLLLFFPLYNSKKKEFTPVCASEIDRFAELFPILKYNGIEPVIISVDNIEIIENWAKKHNLNNVTLLSDTGYEWHQRFTALSKDKDSLRKWVLIDLEGNEIVGNLANEYNKQISRDIVSVVNQCIVAKKYNEVGGFCTAKDFDAQKVVNSINTHK